MRPCPKTQTRPDGVFGASVSPSCHDSPCPQTGPAHPPQSPTHGQGCGQLCRGRRCPDPLPTNCGGHGAGDKDSEPQGGLPDAASMRGAAGVIVSDTFLSKEVAETRDAPQVSLGLHSMPAVAPSCRGPEQSGHLPRDVHATKGRMDDHDCPSVSAVHWDQWPRLGRGVPLPLPLRIPAASQPLGHLAS